MSRAQGRSPSCRVRLWGQGRWLGIGRSKNSLVISAQRAVDAGKEQERAAGAGDGLQDCWSSIDDKEG